MQQTSRTLLKLGKKKQKKNKKRGGYERWAKTRHQIKKGMVAT